MSINLEDFKNIERKSREYKKNFYIIYEGEQTERKYIEFLKNKYNKYKYIEILQCTNSTFCKVERLDGILDKYSEEKKIPINEQDEKIYILDFDIFANNSLANKENLKGIVQKYTLLYSKPSFEYWLLLHYIEESEVEKFMKLNIQEVEQEVKKLKIIRSKKIKENKEEELMLKLETACNNSIKHHEIIEEHIEFINTLNYNKIFTCKENISNVHILFNMINQHIK